MTMQIIKNIKGSELPEEWQHRIDVDVDQYYDVILKSKTENDHMPSEESLSEEIIQSVEFSKKEFEKGNSIRCMNKEDMEKLFMKVWNDE